MRVKAAESTNLTGQESLWEEWAPHIHNLTCKHPKAGSLPARCSPHATTQVRNQDRSPKARVCSQCRSSRFSVGQDAQHARSLLWLRRLLLPHASVPPYAAAQKSKAASRLASARAPPCGCPGCRSLALALFSRLLVTLSTPLVVGGLGEGQHLEEGLVVVRILKGALEEGLELRGQVASAHGRFEQSAEC